MTGTHGMGPANYSDINGDTDIDEFLQTLSVEERRELADSLAAENGVSSPGEVLPTVAFQEEMLAVAERHPSSRCAGIHQVFVLDGHLEPACLRRAWANVQCRHDALRTVFRVERGEWRQKVTSEVGELAIRGTPSVDDTVMTEAVERHRAEGFELAAGPLARAELILGRDDTHILVLSWHHAVVDGYSLGVLWDDLCDAYNGVVDVHEPAQLAVFAREQATARASRVQEVARGIRSAHLTPAGSGPAPLLPRPDVTDLRGTTMRWSRAEKERLTTRAGEQGLTVYMVLLAAYRTALEEVGLLDTRSPVWTPMSGRTSATFARSVGMLVNLVPVFGAVGRGGETSDSLTAVRDGCIQALDRQDVPRNDLIDALPDLPPTSALFALQNNLTGTKTLGPVRRSMPTPAGAPPTAPILEFYSPVRGLFPTAVSIGHVDGGLAGVLEHDRSRVDAATAADVEAQMCHAVAQVIDGANPWRQYGAR